ncbi:glycosyltransferase [Sulfuracidifex tepidarius]|uniref:Glycosyl transferase family 1 domain-containing protein n=1 Tax=Sulfuracidifex tepidarius TaxID=1294262 RepID=A0A510DV86_9CREN|nr:glycosyltransferase [Sulfuracidifex tepidarius]BBG24097.1 hypothetical protein IC006_1398 [Sulfuracidifex tepidarius]BBG26852.1 hypothetical protein IC007_1373 [Sulfuracidifex tepidarius]
MQSIKNVEVGVVAHGLGVREVYSGEGKVYLTSFQMLEEKGVSYVPISFGKPKKRESIHFLPFSLPKFDKYQRILVKIPASRVKPKVFLNLSGVPIPLSRIAPHVIYAGAPAISSLPSKYIGIWRAYLIPFYLYLPKLKREASRCEIIANSKLSAKAISEVYGVREPDVIYPPVDVEKFGEVYAKKDREDMFVTIGRIERGKMLENAVQLSAKTGVKGVIVGSLIERDYLRRLTKLRDEIGAKVEIYHDLPQDQMIELMSTAKVYFHPTLGEHFGIPVVEAMSAGLIPLVPVNSGAYEVVPKELGYNSVEEASSKLKDLLNLDMREKMHEIAAGFSSSAFKARLWEHVSKYL